MARQERKSVKEAAVQGLNDLPSQASIFEAVSKTTCFAGENNLFCRGKQLDFLREISYFAWENKLFC